MAPTSTMIVRSDGGAARSDGAAARSDGGGLSDGGRSEADSVPPEVCLEGAEGGGEVTARRLARRKPARSVNFPPRSPRPREWLRQRREGQRPNP